MAIAFDATSSDSNDAASSLTYSHTCTGSNLTLVVALSNNDNGTLDSVTYNGVSLTLGKDQRNTGNTRVSLWYLKDPATGANDIVATASASTVIRSIGVSYTGTNGTISATTGANASGTSMSTSITTDTANSWVIDALSSDGGKDFVADTGQTERNEVTNTNIRTLGTSDEATTTAGSHTLGWTWTNSSNMAHALIELEELQVADTSLLTILGAG